ncbi:hypothetical protein Trydic_g5002 [Trypoxylus dichotomus]
MIRGKYVQYVRVRNAHTASEQFPLTIASWLARCVNKLIEMVIPDKCGEKAAARLAAAPPRSGWTFAECRIGRFDVRQRPNDVHIYSEMEGIRYNMRAIGFPLNC